MSHSNPMGDMMRACKIAFAAILAIVCGTAAFAADLPKVPILKAPTATTKVCDRVLGCYGWHADFVVNNAGTGINAFNLGEITANGVSAGLGLGGQWYNGSYWIGARADIGYDLSSGAGGFGVANLTGHQVVELGGDAFGALGLAPPVTNGFLSTITTAILTADFGVCEHGRGVGFCAGATAHYLLPNTPLELDIGYLNANYGTTAVSGGNQQIDNILWFGGRYHFQ